MTDRSSSSATPALAAEEDRIRRAYAARSGAARYSLFAPGHLLMMQERERRVLQLLRREGLDQLAPLRILEIGCGTAYWLREFIKWGAAPERAVGIDLLADRIEAARRVCPPSVRLLQGSATSLDVPDGAFDLVLQSTVFTSILDDSVKLRIAREAIRVLVPGGRLLWYDYHVSNPSNADVRGVGRREIETLFDGCRVELHRLTLAPPLVRRLAPLSPALCGALARLPFLCTHFLGVIQKP